MYIILFMFFLFLQAVWVWAVSLPVTVVNATDRNPFLQSVDLIGWLMWAVGFMIEGTADQQKLNFKKSPENRGMWCNAGLWKYTRHPNYFGEVSTPCYFQIQLFFCLFAPSENCKSHIVLYFIFFLLLKQRYILKWKVVTVSITVETSKSCYHPIQGIGLKACPAVRHLW